MSQCAVSAESPLAVSHDCNGLLTFRTAVVACSLTHYKISRFGTIGVFQWLVLSVCFCTSRHGGALRVRYFG